MSELCVGLFGTCGASNWRKPFIAKFEELGIRYFNPQVAEGTWHPGMVDNENKHLREDDIILFPVTNETTAQGSLGEIGFSIKHALRANRQRYFVFLIDRDCIDPKANEAHIAESVRSRHLVRSKVEEEAVACHNIFLVDTLDQMLEITLRLHTALTATSEIEKTYKTA